MTAPLDRTSQIAGRSWTHPVPKFWIGVETHDSWHIPLEAAPLRLRLAAAQCEEEQKKGAAKAEVQAARQRSELPERSLSWRALSHGIGRCGNLVSFLILFDPVFANLHFTVSRSFSCSHMGENCRAETSNTLVDPQFLNFQSDPSMCLWHFSPNSMATLRVS